MKKRKNSFELNFFKKSKTKDDNIFERLFCQFFAKNQQKFVFFNRKKAFFLFKNVVFLSILFTNVLISLLSLLFVLAFLYKNRKFGRFSFLLINEVRS